MYSTFAFGSFQGSMSKYPYETPSRLVISGSGSGCSTDCQSSGANVFNIPTESLHQFPLNPRDRHSFSLHLMTSTVDSERHHSLRQHAGRCGPSDRRSLSGSIRPSPLGLQRPGLFFIGATGGGTVDGRRDAGLTATTARVDLLSQTGPIFRL